MPRLLRLKRGSTHPFFSHKFRFTGTIRRIGRQKVERVSLHSLDIEVSDVVVIGSEQVNELEEWRTDSSLRTLTIDVTGLLNKAKARSSKNK